MTQSMLIQRFIGEPGGLLKALHALQNSNTNNFLSPQDLELVSGAFGVPLAKVWGVATFYSLYSTIPRGRYIIRVCESAPCHVVGAHNILTALAKNLNICTGETTADGKFTLEVTSCLGICGVAPAIMINDTVHGNLTPESLASVLALYN
ncbi:MAG: NAD(P)H-dependent oxidoreductase subunit E [Peptococcaceae bacterium]|nr:NAD(P)H-dependent oxidoreductase subunit E [Peptococcaceae bacterium]